MSKLISELPHSIKITAMRYSNMPNEDDLAASFVWEETNEGNDVWNEIYKGNYDPFYDYHITKQKLTPKQWCEEKGYNKYHVMIIEQYMNDIGK